MGFLGKEQKPAALIGQAERCGAIPAEACLRNWATAFFFEIGQLFSIAFYGASFQQQTPYLANTGR